MPPSDPAGELADDLQRREAWRQSVLERLDELLRLVRWRLARTRGGNTTAVATHDIVNSVVATVLGSRYDQPPAPRSEEDDPVWTALRQALDRKLYRHFEARQDLRATDVAGDDEAWIGRIADGRVEVEDLAACLAIRHEFIDRLTPDERRLAELLFLGYSQPEISEAIGLSPARVRRQVASLRAELVKLGYDAP